MAIDRLAVAVLSSGMPCHCIGSSCSAVASYSQSLPLLCLAGLAVALQRRSGRIRRSAKLSVAPLFRSHAGPVCAMPRRRRSTRCRGFANLYFAFPPLVLAAPRLCTSALRIAMPSQCPVLLCYAIAFPSCPMPPQISSVVCLCATDPCYALASPLTASPCLCKPCRCGALAMLPNAMPPPGRSFHSHAIAVPAYAFPLRIRAVPFCPCRALAPRIFASPCFASAFAPLRLTAPSHCKSSRRLSYLRPALAPGILASLRHGSSHRCPAPP